MSDAEDNDACYRMLVIGPTGRCLLELRDNRVTIEMEPKHPRASTLVVEQKHRNYVLLNRAHPDMKRQFEREMDQIVPMIEGHADHSVLFHGVAECILSRIYLCAEPVRKLFIKSLGFEFVSL